MMCPRCNSERTRLSWLRDFAVLYWCTECHADFEVDRTRKKAMALPRIDEKTTASSAVPGK